MCYAPELPDDAIPAGYPVAMETSQWLLDEAGERTERGRLGLDLILIDVGRPTY